MVSNLSIAIVGLPNAGKSTLFNALVGRQIANVANYPFCTIDPNVGVVEVPDEKLDKLAEMSESIKKINPIVEFVDIAGLIKGASKGEGLGNKFLDNIRKCDAICHVVRGFSDTNVIKTGSDPMSDFEVVCTELILKDLETIDKFIDNNKKNIDSKKEYEVALKLKTELDKGNLAINIKLDSEEEKISKQFFLLTAKPYFIVVNLDEETYKKTSIFNLQSSNDMEVVPICAKIEQELAEFSNEEKIEFLNELGIEEAGLEKVIKRAYQALGLQSFYTTGKKESRAWTIRVGAKAPEAAGVIHTDFERGFIMAEVISFDELIVLKDWKKAKEMGKIRHEGRDYLMRPDDVVEFRFNV